jgi:DNA polymerase (family 10)
MTNGLDDARAMAHIERIREVDAELQQEYGGRIRVLPGIEVDILADGALDLDDSALAQMDIVVASVHSHFAQPLDEMTARVLRAMENPHVRILGHPTGRKVLSREAYAINVDSILRRAAALGVAVEHNASPARSDLNDLNLRLAKEHGCKIVVDTDAHATEELDQMRYGITQLRRAWLTKDDILNTQPTAEALLAQLRPKP